MLIETGSCRAFVRLDAVTNGIRLIIRGHNLAARGCLIELDIKMAGAKPVLADVGPLRRSMNHRLTEPGRGGKDQESCRERGVQHDYILNNFQG